MVRSLSAVALAAALTPGSAWACGGFFCNREAPVDQSGEVIVFGVDEPAGEVTMHVRVAYEGPSAEFAWVVPVKGVPDLFLSTDALFGVLPAWTAPSHWATYRFEDCPDGWWYGNYPYDYDVAFGGSYSASSSRDDSGTTGVTVLAEETVGAYETVTLSATDSTVLVEWLQANAYDVPDELSTALDPYLAAGSNFLALKLAKGSDTGDLAPLGVRYEGTKAGIPLQLTAIAATEDMPMTVYMLGHARGVPLNYLHVGLNPLAIDFWTGGSNYDEVISRAADEAGGQAFATDFAGPSAGLSESLYTDQMFDAAGMASYTDAATFVSALPMHGFAGTSDVLEVLRDEVPVPAGFPDTEQDFYNCPDCYPTWYAQVPFDATSASDALQTRIVEPRASAAAMIDQHPWLTRLRSSVSPSEMTVDPLFGFNPDLPEVDRQHILEIVRDCDTPAGVVPHTEAAQILQYDGRAGIRIPSEAWLNERGMTAFQWVKDLVVTNALSIEQMYESGPPDVLVDNEPFLPEADGAGEPAAETGGCGCASAAPAGVGAPLLLGLLALGRRRS